MALVDANFGDGSRSAADAPQGHVPLGVGAAMVHGSSAWVLVEDRPERGLGVALTWALRQQAEYLHVIVPHGAGGLARRAAEFDLDIAVWSTDGTSTTLMRAEPAPLTGEPAVDPRHLAFVDLIRDSGADVVIEHGVICGEVRGLEVCRVVTDSESAECRLEVGVGVHDREAFGLLHGDTPTADSLRRIVDVVAVRRLPTADPHPLNRLGAERALRSRVIGEPSLIGAGHLHTAAPAEPRPNLKDPVPCVAVGETVAGRPLVAVFSSGVDIDVVPFAADARLFHAISAIDSGADPRLDVPTELVIAVPERDATTLTRQLAAALRVEARVIGLPAT